MRTARSLTWKLGRRRARHCNRECGGRRHDMGERGYLVFEHQWPLRGSSGCLRQLQNSSLVGACLPL